MNKFELMEEPENTPPSELQKLRWGIGADILIQMDEEDENGQKSLPQPNVWALTELMQVIFVRDGHEDSLPSHHKWRPTASYWASHLKEVRKVLRDEKQKYFEYVREQGALVGEWRFVNKQEYESVLAREYQGISTRGETYEERLNDSKWKLRVPHVPEIPRIAN